MRVLLTCAVAMIVLSALCGASAARGDRRAVANVQRSRPDLAYTSHGKLWLRSLSGTHSWQIPTPWPVSGLSWSPDGVAIAFEGKRGLGVLVLRGHSGQTVFSRRFVICCDTQLAWSPNGRYLAFSVDTRNLGFADLWLWDRATDQALLLVHKVILVEPFGTWSNDSTRFAVAVGGQLLNVLRTPRLKVVNVSSDRVTYLGKGVPGAWSPDDRFLGFDHLLVCGATGCFEREGIIPASGGRVTVLARSIRAGWRTYEAWAPRRYGYAYDRWLLGPHGHERRRIPGRFDRVQSWSQDGQWVAVRTITRSLRIVLTLVNADTGRSRRIFISAPTGDCDACMNQGYQLTWNSRSTAFALLTPHVFGGIKEVTPSLYRYSLGSSGAQSRLTKGIRMKHPYPTGLGWVNRDREVIVYSGRTLFRYVLARQRLVPIVGGLPYSDSIFDNDAPSAGLRPGA